MRRILVFRHDRFENAIWFDPVVPATYAGVRPIGALLDLCAQIRFDSPCLCLSVDTPHSLRCSPVPAAVAFRLAVPRSLESSIIATRSRGLTAEVPTLPGSTCRRFNPPLPTPFRTSTDTPR